MSTPPRLNHENLDAYQVAIDFLALVSRLPGRWPRGYGPMADQLRRAALSIPLNIAEGYGKRRADDRGRFYDIARGSAHELRAPFWTPGRSSGSSTMPRSNEARCCYIESSRCSSG